MRNCASEVWSGACHRAARGADPLGPSRNDEHRSQLANLLGAAALLRPVHCGRFRPILRCNIPKNPRSNAMSPTAAARTSQPSASSLRDRLKDPSLLRDRCYIDGAWVGTPSRPVTNPVNGVELAKVPVMSTAEATQAVEAAERAFPAWAKFTAKQRSNILRKWFDLIIANREDLALILTSEQGKPLTEALGEVDIGGAYVEFFAEEARRVYGETIPSQRPDARLLAIKQPIGVCGAITPWNFPCSMITRKVSPAVAAGCTVLVKPANETPLSALALAALDEKAGVPKGVFNIITGDAP